MNINGMEIDFRIGRLKDAAAFELALDKLAASEKRDSAKKGRKLSDVIKDSIDIFRDFFKDATGADILDDCDDLDVAKNSYLQFLEEVQSQKAALLKPFDSDHIR